ncbi:uncharacterized protein IAS62_002738 [Cryptococcus decagattii]|uniref:Exonuclease domain-containing protein n=1 Tax=Cryptococcus decagattii TaxID=1859122 RepID=A0ABZ2ASD4_9TREE
MAGTNNTRFPPLEKYVALDCEMVQLRNSMGLAKIGIVDAYGNILMESFVRHHPANVVNYITRKSGIRPQDLVGAPTYEQIQPQIIELVKDKIIVGHTLFNDLAVIGHRHQYEMMRDTALYDPLRNLVGVRSEGIWPSLKKLAAAVLNEDMHAAGIAHDPVEDARMTMAIFMTVREEYEDGLWRGKDVVACLPERYVSCYW